MSFPKHYIKLILVDIPLYKFTDDDNSCSFSRSIYLPFSRNLIYASKFDSLTIDFNVYLRLNELPKSLKKLIPKIVFARLKTRLFITLSHSEYFPPFRKVNKWYQTNRHKYTNIDEWIQLIQQAHKGIDIDEERKCSIYLSSILLTFACSENVFKKQMCIL